jgi:hypothetical protein
MKRFLICCCLLPFLWLITSTSSSASLMSQGLIIATVPCLWTEADGEALLARRVEALSVTDERVEVAVAKLSAKSDLPLSFIQAMPDAKVSLDLKGVTVRQALDALVAQAPVYRYENVAGRIVLYPRDPKWEMRIDDLQLGPAPRVQMAKSLANELSRRLPAFGDLGGPWVLGDPRAYTYKDVVTVKGPGSVLQLLLQLLGNRRSTYLLVVREKGWLGPSLSVSSRDQLDSIELTTPVKTLTGRGQSVQIKVLGTLDYGKATRDLTAGACGTRYTVSNERVLTVSTDGVVTARGNGEAEVTASNEHFSRSIALGVNVIADGVRSDAQEDPASSAPVKPRSMGVTVCPWLAESGQRLLDRQIGPLFHTDATVAEIANSLVREYSVPLSFIEAEPSTRISVRVERISVGQLLDLIVARNAEYRYRFVGERLVLYPVASVWDLPIDNLRIAPGPRRWVSEALILELRKRIPALEQVGTPWTFGDPQSFIYQDEVTVPSKGSVLELLTKILGDRASSVFTVAKVEGQMGLGLGSVDLVRSLSVTVSTTAPRVGDTVQLSVVGTLRDGARQNLTQGECGTAYSISDKRILRVSPSGLVTAIGAGETEVTVVNENVASYLAFQVTPGKRSPL